MAGVAWPSFATIATRSANGQLWKGGFAQTNPSAFGLATAGNRTNLLGSAPGLSGQLTAPVLIGRTRKIVLLGLFST